jgi:NAD-dependent deacetylase
MEEAINIVESADILCIIGTSLNVYPAAGLFRYAPFACRIWLIDPNPPSALPRRIKVIARGAGDGVAAFMKEVNNDK